MRRRKKITLVILTALVVVLIVFFIFAWRQYERRKAQAVTLAQAYLAERYNQEMQFEHVYHRVFADPALYVVFFTPTDQPHLFFDVIVQYNLTILGDAQEFGKISSPDNYLLRYFEYYAEQDIQPDIEKIWDETVEFSVWVEDSGIYSHSSYAGIHENMPVLEMEPLLEYRYVITPGQVLTQTSIEAEAQKIFTLLQAVRESPFHPSYFAFHYDTGEKKRTSIFGKSEAVRERVVIEDLDSIVSVEQVLQQLTAQWSR